MNARASARAKRAKANVDATREPAILCDRLQHGRIPGVLLWRWLNRRTLLQEIHLVSLTRSKVLRPYPPRAIGQGWLALRSHRQSPRLLCARACSNVHAHGHDALVMGAGGWRDGERSASCLRSLARVGSATCTCWYYVKRTSQGSGSVVWQYDSYSGRTGNRNNETDIFL